MSFQDIGAAELLFIAKWYALPIGAVLAYTWWLLRMRRTQRAHAARLQALEQRPER